MTKRRQTTDVPLFFLASIIYLAEVSGATLFHFKISQPTNTRLVLFVAGHLISASSLWILPRRPHRARSLSVFLHVGEESAAAFHLPALCLRSALAKPADVA